MLFILTDSCKKLVLVVKASKSKNNINLVWQYLSLVHTVFRQSVIVTEDS